MADEIEIVGNLHHNVKLYPADIKVKNTLARRLLYLVQLRKTFRQIACDHKIDIIHQLNPVVPGITLALAGLEGNKPVILGPIVAKNPVTSKNIFTASRRLFKKVLLSLQQMRASALLAVTPAACNRIFTSKSVMKKMSYITHGIDAASFQATDSNRFDATDPKILFLGKVTSCKGIFVLLDAFEKVVKNYPSCQLWVGGSLQKDASEVKARIDRMDSNAQLRLLGVVPRNKVPELMQACTVVCVPSFYEPFGMVALEAMSCGKPVVGSDCGGLHYLIPEQGGRTVQPEDSVLLAKALLEVIQSPELQQEMGRYNRRLVEQTYDWEEVVNQLETTYYDSIDQQSLK